MAMKAPKRKVAVLGAGKRRHPDTGVGKSRVVGPRQHPGHRPPPERADALRAKLKVNVGTNKFGSRARRGCDIGVRKTSSGR